MLLPLAIIASTSLACAGPVGDPPPAPSPSGTREAVAWGIAAGGAGALAGAAAGSLVFAGALAGAPPEVVVGAAALAVPVGAAFASGVAFSVLFSGRPVVDEMLEVGACSAVGCVGVGAMTAAVAALLSSPADAVAGAEPGGDADESADEGDEIEEDEDEGGPDEESRVLDNAAPPPPVAAVPASLWPTAGAGIGAAMGVACGVLFPLAVRERNASAADHGLLLMVSAGIGGAAGAIIGGSMGGGIAGSISAGEE